LQVTHTGLYIRIRWRLWLKTRYPPCGDAAAGALRAAQGAFETAVPSNFGGWLKTASNDLIGEVEQWTQNSETQEKKVELNSIYELDCWIGRILQHTLEFRSPSEDFGLLDVLQGVPSYR